MAGPSLGDYLRRAFFFRPPGMFVPPNLVGLAAFALLGVREPGLWLVGLGLELGYLLALVSWPRFRALVDREAGVGEAARQDALDRVVAKLSPAGRERFGALRERCEALLAHPTSGEAEAEALSSLLQVQLELLGAREGLVSLLSEADRSVDERLRQLRLRAGRADPALKASLQGQIEVLERRSAAQAGARTKLEFVDGELQRVDDQVELLREQTLLQAESTAGADRIGAIAHALDTTRRWLADERASGPGDGAPEVPEVRLRRPVPPRQAQ